MNPKQRAAEAAMSFVKSGMVVGLGTGTTADFFLVALANAIKSGKLAGVRGIPTSKQSEHRAQELGIPLTNLVECPRADVTIDGADEIAPNLDLIKGLGGALLREKIVAQNSKQLIIIADAGKRVDVLGTKSPLPVEIAMFAHECHVPFLKGLGASPSLRPTADGKTFITDNGNCIYDCRFNRIDDPRRLEAALLDRAGIIDCGLFLGMASIALVADDQRVTELRASPSSPQQQRRHQ
ncbi:MAG TPA: ribose-5-phosphate isomerase RpiA [Tepidisphaeraceae bacterium]|jgi:ribose 5-phosphate isomerase A|nr:ribose-5-phosphate isomerase RpiA [Tepidisphaeraceae bacterium]